MVGNDADQRPEGWCIVAALTEICASRGCLGCAIYCSKAYNNDVVLSRR